MPMRPQPSTKTIGNQKILREREIVPFREHANRLFNTKCLFLISSRYLQGTLCRVSRLYLWI